MADPTPSTPPPKATWWQMLGHGQLDPSFGTGGLGPLNWLVQPSDTPAVSLLKHGLRATLGVSETDPTTGKPIGIQNLGDALSHLVQDPWEYFISSHPKDPSPGPAPTQQPTDSPPAPADPSQPVLTLPGTMKYQDPPKPPPITPVDYSGYRKALEGAAPVAPTETEDDKIGGILGGLAAGLQNIPGGGRNTGNLLLNLGMGAIGGLAGEKADYKKAMRAYQDSVQAFKEKTAGSELGIAEQRGKESNAQAQMDQTYAEDVWKYHQQQIALTQPKVLSAKGGVVTYSMTSPDGTVTVHSMGSTAPSDKPYYVTQAGQFPADQSMGAAFAGIDYYAKTGRLAGTDTANTKYLLDPDRYKQFQEVAQQQLMNETQHNPSMPTKDQSQIYYANLYQLIWNYAIEKGGAQQLLNLGQSAGTQKVSKAVATPEVTSADTE